MYKNTTHYGSLFNKQQLLFKFTNKVSGSGTRLVSDDYYDHGWIIISDIPDAYSAAIVQEQFINSIDISKLPMQARFASRIQLAKADKIPVCDDIVATSFQVLHFDMGIPLVESENQMYITHVGLYLPPTTDHEITASTRIVGLAGLLNTPSINPNLLENNLVEYVKSMSKITETDGKITTRFA